MEKVCLRTCLDPWASTTNRKMTCIPTHLVGWVKLMSSSYSWLEPKVPNMFGAKFCPFFWRGWGGGCLGKDWKLFIRKVFWEVKPLPSLSINLWVLFWKLKRKTNNLQTSNISIKTGKVISHRLRFSINTMNLPEKQQV